MSFHREIVEKSLVLLEAPNENSCTKINFPLVFSFFFHFYMPTLFNSVYVSTCVLVV